VQSTAAGIETSPARHSSDLRHDLARIREHALAPAAGPTALAGNLQSALGAFLDIDYLRYDLVRHREVAPDCIDEIFLLREGLRESVAGWHKRDMMSRPAQKSMRDLLRVARYATDILGELWIGNERLASDVPTKRAFTGQDCNTQVSDAFKSGDRLPFKTGDVILVRGRLHNSAAIARIGDIDSQFSHVAMVYIDQQGRHWAVESLIEEGAVVHPLMNVLNHDLGRAVLFRHRDATLAQNAGYLIHDRIRHSHTWQGKRILYDFTMRPNEGRNLFCSKLVRRAFREASDGRVILPTFPTRLDMRNRDFMDRIGVRTIETFAPGDFELEPDFDVVAEWQDFRVTANLRLQDMVMDRIFAWMEEHGYRFRETFKIRLISLLGRASSFLFDDIKDMIDEVVPKVPVNMSRSAIAVIAMLHNTAQPMLEHLQALDREHIAKTGLPMHPRGVVAALEAYRVGHEKNLGYLRKPRR